jgi:hypothetical protein
MPDAAAEMVWLVLIEVSPKKEGRLARQLLLTRICKVSGPSVYQ